MLNNLYTTPKKSVFILIALMAIFSTIYNSFIPLHGDEAYYWMWSQHLQTGYYDHPPMIAYLIYLTNFISESEWGIRLVNIFSVSISAIYIFKLSAEIVDEKTALNAVIIFMSVILVQAAYIITTPDSPLIMFWTLSLYFSYMAIFYGRLKDFILTGFMIGFMMLSKYTSILLVFSIFIFILIKKREVLLNIRFYLALIIAFIIILPMLLWNYQYDWISFGFQLDHGSTDDFNIKLSSTLEFLAGQFGAFSPIFAWILFYYMFKEKLFFKNEKLFFIAISVYFTLGFFLYKALFKTMALNYGAPAYIGGVILVSYLISKYELKRSFKIGLIIALFFSIVARFMFIFYLDIIRDEMYKSDKAIEWFVSHKEPTDKLYGDHLTTSAYIEYYTKEHTESDLAIDSRYSQYDMWRDKDYLQDGIVLTRYRKRDKELKKNFKNVQLIDTLIVIPDKRVFYTYRVSEAIK